MDLLLSGARPINFLLAFHYAYIRLTDPLLVVIVDYEHVWQTIYSIVFWIHFFGMDLRFCLVAIVEKSTTHITMYLPKHELHIPCIMYTIYYVAPSITPIRNRTS